MNVWDLLLLVITLPVALAAGYLALLAVAARPRPLPEPADPKWKFDVIIPAHNEELGIAQTVRSLEVLDYPAALRSVWVVADNCQDDTATRAQEAGAHILVRENLEKRGKGYALELAFGQSHQRGFADAVVVIDADTTVSPNLLKAFAACLDRGDQAMQASYGVRNPQASWRTRLMRMALALFNDLRSIGRDRLGWSTGLRGNGMCFTTRLLQEVPHQAYSLVEDLEYGIRLGQAGRRVRCVHEAQVKGEMVSGERASRSQRRRWEGGRRHLAREKALPLLREAIRRRSGLLFDLAADLLVPPLSALVLATLGVTAMALAVAWRFQTVALLSLWTALLSDAALIFYVLRGWALSGVGPRGLLDLLWSPVFIVWKLMLVLKGPEHGKGAWVRTRREGEDRAP